MQEMAGVRRKWGKTVKSFPAKGRSADDLLREMRSGRGGDADWRYGRTFSLVYNPVDPKLERLQEAVAVAYLHENYLNPFAFPSLLRMERDVIAMGAYLLHGEPPGGRLTSGGTESIFLAVQVARDHAKAQRKVTTPNIVVPSTAHAAFAKACHYLGVTEVRVPVLRDGTADVAATARKIDENTVLVVGSAPCYPYGVVDPIVGLAALAKDAGTLCHVDACLGGWLLPFLERLGEGIPLWDFRVDGVTSISADIHKYGWCFKGVSLLVHREYDRLKDQFFVFDGWPGGVYGSATTAGTRPAAPIAAAWATISYLGEDGYLRLAEQVQAASRAFKDGIAAIKGLHVTGNPVSGVLEIASDTLDVDTIANEMDERGWHLDRQQGGLHAILSPSHVAVAEEFLADLAQAAAIAEEGPKRDPSAPRYGGIA
jgi:sphinganine-1-phosphate aldolase